MKRMKPRNNHNNIMNQMKRNKRRKTRKKRKKVETAKEKDNDGTIIEELCGIGKKKILRSKTTINKNEE